MIYKVYYQESPTTAPVREHTKSLYVDAASEQEVRTKLSNRNYNIEFIQSLSEAHLAYEQKSEHYQVENI